MKTSISIQSILQSLIETGNVSTPVYTEAYPLGVGAVMPGDLPTDWMSTAVESYQTIQQ